ncbi:hypothetical protein BKA80DRAFT_274592 [Phyllosticta citrichinensis]
MSHLSSLSRPSLSSLSLSRLSLSLFPVTLFLSSLSLSLSHTVAFIYYHLSNHPSDHFSPSRAVSTISLHFFHFLPSLLSHLPPPYPPSPPSPHPSHPPSPIPTRSGRCLPKQSTGRVGISSPQGLGGLHQQTTCIR